jgi:hypothetical protein
MAYDPKSFLDQALKTGFQPVYGGPQSSEDTNLVYQGDAAKFGNVEVRPVSDYVGSDDQFTAVPSGYMVSVPLTGEYEGYHRNDSYDNDGNFLRTTISEPPESFGTALANFALTAASFGGFGPIATAAANAYKGIQALKSGDILSAAASILPGVGQIPGVSPETVKTLKTYGDYAKTGSALQKAIESKDILGALGAASDIPGVPQVPSDITDILKGVGQASRIREAVKNDNFQGLFNEIVGASKAGGKSGNGYFPGYETPGEIQEGFFDVGGPGYMEPDAGDLPDWALDPYKDDTPTFKLPTDEDYEELESILLRYPEQQERAAEPKTSMSPNELNKFLEANIDDPDTIEMLMQDYFPELYRQSIDVTGTLPKKDVIIPDWDVLPPAVEPPKSIRDIGNVTKVSPDEPLEGTEIKEPDLVTGLTPAKVDTTKPTTPGAKPTTPATPATSKDPNLAWLAALFGAMGGQGQDRQAPAQVNVARGTPESPFGLMYDLRG